MNAVFQLKGYQERTLEALDLYFRRCIERGEPKRAFIDAFTELTGNAKAYNAISGFPADMPYVCLRLPTGGGKTLLAGFACALANQRLLHIEHSLVLWLVPSRAIMAQTLRTLKNRKDPLRRGLEEGWGRWPGCGKVSVMDLAEARSITRATLDTETVIIVATAQAFRVEDTEIRKVYESSGALMHHFEGLNEEQRRNLRTEENGAAVFSLENVFRLRRPVLVVDEAHNARSELSFETLARFRPSCILELTATPDEKKNPSNVLHSVSAGELKEEQMVKLPILLAAETNWQNLLAGAIARRNDLRELARREEADGGDYVRPIVLIQAQPQDHKTGKDTLHAEKIKAELMENHHIPEAEIAIATGTHRELDDVDLFSKSCPVNYVITQQALAEGWDCSFAYVLASVAEMASPKAVEQLLGRVLRMPFAQSRATPALNKAYAFVLSSRFRQAAETLRDALVNCAGFERKDASEFITAARADQLGLGISSGDRRRAAPPVAVTLVEKVKVETLPPEILDKIEWEPTARKLTIKVPLADTEKAAVKGLFTFDADKDEIERANGEIQAQAVEIFRTPSERGLAFTVPRMAVMVNGELQLFDDPEVLDYPWKLPLHEAEPSVAERSAVGLACGVSEGGAIDVEDGKVTTQFLPELHEELALAYQPEHVSEARLAGWLCRNLIDPYTEPESLMAFLSAWLSHLIGAGVSLQTANRLKFIIRGLLEKRLRTMRDAAKLEAFQLALFSTDSRERVKVGGEFVFEFHPDAYSPGEIYPRGGEMRHHYYPQVGKLDSKDEEKCAWHLEHLCETGKLAFWVRNLVRKGSGAFFLQKATGRFYPDFLARLPDGRSLVVEVKGEDRWMLAEDDRQIGALWAEMSGGNALFLMIRATELGKIDALLG
jgi:type III restriction enzyme